MIVPQLYVRGRETNALRILKRSAKPEGVTPFAGLPGRKPTDSSLRYSDLTGRFEAHGWMECRRTGPRGGKRYFATTLGLGVLEIVAEHGDRYREHLWIAYPEMIKQK